MAPHLKSFIGFIVFGGIFNQILILAQPTLSSLSTVVFGTFIIFKISKLHNRLNVIEGHVSIDIDVNQDANNITLHIKDIKIFENMVSLTSLTQKNAQIPIEGHGYDQDREFYIVKADVKAGDKYRLSIGYHAELNDNLAGFYRSTYRR